MFFLGWRVPFWAVQLSQEEDSRAKAEREGEEREEAEGLWKRDLHGDHLDSPRTAPFSARQGPALAPAALRTPAEPICMLSASRAPRARSRPPVHSARSPRRTRAIKFVVSVGRGLKGRWSKQIGCKRVLFERQDMISSARLSRKGDVCARARAPRPRARRCVCSSSPLCRVASKYFVSEIKFM